MTDTDPLNAFFKAGEAPAVDHDFRAGVMEAVARRRLRIELAVRTATAALIFLAAAILAPALGPAISLVAGQLSTFLLALAVVGIIGFSGNWLSTHAQQLSTRRFF